MNAFVAKLQSYVDLTAADRRALAAATERTRQVGPRQSVIDEGDEPNAVTVILEGWACRYKHLKDGRRQILSFLLPGDMCEPSVFLLRHVAHSMATLTPVTLARMSEETVRGLMNRSQAISDAFNYDMLIDTEIQREWTVSIGQRTSAERLAHLFCEILERLSIAGLIAGPEYDMPVTQIDLADALGMSGVHTNRTLQEMRRVGLVSLRGRHLRVHDLQGLQRLALFNPRYLHRQR